MYITEVNRGRFAQAPIDLTKWPRLFSIPVRIQVVSTRAIHVQVIEQSALGAFTSAKPYAFQYRSPGPQQMVDQVIQLPPGHLYLLLFINLNEDEPPVSYVGYDVSMVKGGG